MNHPYRARGFVVIACITLNLILGLSMIGPAAARGPVPSRASIKPDNACQTTKPAQAPLGQELTTFASNTLCNLYTSTAAKARVLFVGNNGLQYLPWAPIMVGLVFICFLVLGAWCSLKMKGYRPRRKYNIGRVI